MVTRSLRTADYSDDARRRLGEAIGAARRAAGFKWRTNFARRHSNISVSSLAAVELAKPLVGVAVLEAIGTALGEHFPGRWSKDTPRQILEGGPIPELLGATPASDPRVSAVITADANDPAFWLALQQEVPPETFRQLWQLYVEKKDALRRLTERGDPNQTV